jgi:GDP-4-dehydro-6-deoxy-D-mannose reductase
MSQSPCNLVTGALGFVGLYLVEALLRAGIPVVGLSRLDPGQPPPAQAGNFTLVEDPGPPPGAAHLHGSVRYHGEAGDWYYLHCPLEEPDPVRNLLDTLRPTAVYHLAAQSSAAVSFTDPGDTFASNLIGTLHLLEAVRALPQTLWPVVLAVGSAEEYGDQSDRRQPLTEDLPLEPISPYGVSKAAQTMLCRQYARSYALPVVIARPFNHTGPGQDQRFAFPSFAAQIAAAEAGTGPAEISVGNLSAVRDFLDVRDVIAAYRLLVATGTPGEVYNICSGQPLTIADGLDLLRAAAELPITLRDDPQRQRPSDIPYLVGDNRKFIAQTGWSPEYDRAGIFSALLQYARRPSA